MIITVDTGGTKTLVSSFDNKGIPGKKYRFPTPENQNEYVQTLLATLRENYDNTDADAIVVAMPGVVEKNVFRGGGNLPWRDFSLADELSRFYSCPIWLENDANLAALSEANALPTTVPVCLYLTISTGIGSGVIINGRLIPELSQSEAGGMMLEFDGRLRRWESFASGKAIYKLYGKYAYEITSERTWRRITKSFAVGLGAIIPILQPDVIIIGGSIGTHYQKYKQTLHSLLDETLPAHIKRPKIIQASHPQEAVIYGCYYHAVHQLSR